MMNVSARRSLGCWWRKRGIKKKTWKCDKKIETLFAKQFVVSKIAVTIHCNGKRFMIIRYAPGSLVTRERSAIAAARVIDEDYRIPLAVVSNGEDAELLDTATGQVLATGLEAIPDKKEATKLFDTLDFSPFIGEKKRERELRILNAFDIEVCCAGGPCALPQAPEG